MSIDLRSSLLHIAIVIISIHDGGILPRVENESATRFKGTPRHEYDQHLISRCKSYSLRSDTNDQAQLLTH